LFDHLEKYLKLPVDFVEIRASNNHSTHLSLEFGEMKEAIAGDTLSLSIRVMDKGVFGFSATNNLDRMQEAAKSAMRLVKVSQKKPFKQGLSEEKACKDQVTVKAAKKPLDYSLDEKASDLLELGKGMKLPKIVNYNIDYGDTTSSAYYLNSEGARLEFDNIVSSVGFRSYAKEGSIQSAHYSCGGCYGYEILDKFWDRGEKTSRQALELLGAEKIKSGRYDAVLGPEISGVMAHEAVGHACEADFIITNESILNGKLGKKIGSELVTICDNPTLEGTYGYYPYDDEGVKSKKTVMIKDGVVNSYLHSRETARKLGVHSTGNARAQSPFHSPIVRMSNTYFDKGDFSRDEIFDIKRGIYLERSKGGAVDVLKGEFQFASEMGYIIENGEITKPVRDASIFGSILDMLKNVDAVGKDLEYHGGGHCGKGQLVRVTTGGPHIRVKGAKIGGS